MHGSTIILLWKILVSMFVLIVHPYITLYLIKQFLLLFHSFFKELHVHVRSSRNNLLKLQCTMCINCKELILLTEPFH